MEIKNCDSKLPKLNEIINFGFDITGEIASGVIKASRKNDQSPVVIKVLILITLMNIQDKCLLVKL